MNDTSEPRGFQFPGLFEITAMGAADAGLDALVPSLLEGIGLEIAPGSLRTRASSKGAYVSVAVGFIARSREDYDAAHDVLRGHPAVKWTL